MAVVQAWAILAGDAGNGVIGRRVGPDEVEVAAGVCRGIAITQRGHNVRQFAMLPADEDVALALVAVNDLLDAVGIRFVAGSIDGDAKRLGQRLDRVVRSLVFATLRTRVRSAIGEDGGLQTHPSWGPQP